jgi:hypothetical protein
MSKQTRLQKHYGDTIVIESQKRQGQSNILRYLFSFILIHFNHIYLVNARIFSLQVIEIS